MIRKKNPVRMAQRWKLVPTARHKKCVNSDTLCGVYIGNGSKKCPKCNMLQPMKKRKRDSSDKGKKKKKKKEYVPGDMVKAYWGKYDKWLEGCVSDKRRTQTNKYEYDVRVFFNVGLKEGVKKMYETIDIPWDEVVFSTIDFGHNPDKLFHWTIKLSSEELEYTLEKGDKIDVSFIEHEMQIFYDNFKERKWKELDKSYPGIFLKKQKPQNKIKVQFTNDWVSSDFYESMQKNCCGLIDKYLPNFLPHENKMHNCFKGLRVGHNIKFDMDGHLKIGKIIQLYPRFIEDESCIKVQTDLDKTVQKTVVIDAKTNFKHWIKYQLFYEEMNEQRPYNFSSCVELNKQLIIFLNECRPNDKKVLKIANFQMNSHKYDIVIHLCRTDDTSVHYSFAGSYQQNIETKVKRRVTIHHVKPPKLKQLSDYKKDITRSIGKHRWIWLDSSEAVKDLGSTVEHPNNVRFLGCTKFINIFANLSERKNFYDKFNIETKIVRRFHGTHSRNLFSILHPLGGFAMATEANGKCYGQGIYFAKSPYWVYENSYAPQGVSNLRCIIVADIICGRELQQSTDTWHRNASLVKSTSSIRYNERGDITGAVLDSNKFELTGGCASRNIDVVWYDRCKTDINITHVLWYK